MYDDGCKINLFILFSRLEYKTLKKPSHHELKIRSKKFGSLKLNRSKGIRIHLFLIEASIELGFEPPIFSFSHLFLCVVFMISIVQLVKSFQHTL